MKKESAGPSDKTNKTRMWQLLEITRDCGEECNDRSTGGVMWRCRLCMDLSWCLDSPVNLRSYTHELLKMTERKLHRQSAKMSFLNRLLHIQKSPGEVFPDTSHIV